jgi:hypothetical protein
VLAGDGFEVCLHLLGGWRVGNGGVVLLDLVFEAPTERRAGAEEDSEDVSGPVPAMPHALVVVNGRLGAGLADGTQLDVGTGSCDPSRSSGWSRSLVQPSPYRPAAELVPPNATRVRRGGRPVPTPSLGMTRTGEIALQNA